MAARQTVLLELSYRGSAFHGVHPQPHQRTVGGDLLVALERVVGVAPNGLSFAARTDAGVSAEQNFASLWFRDAPPLLEISSPRFDTLQVDWSIRRAWFASRSVNARNDAVSKTYRYIYEHGCSPSRCEDIEGGASERVWRVVPELDAERMQQAAARLVGTHDFSAFRAARCGAKNPSKTITHIKLETDGPRISVEITGDAFLRKMVRIIAGTLAELGAGLRPVESIEDILASRVRRQAGLTAPARGLTLLHVDLTRDVTLLKTWWSPPDAGQASNRP